MFPNRSIRLDISNFFRTKCFLSCVSNRETRETPDHRDLQLTLVTLALLFKVTLHKIQTNNFMDRSKGHWDSSVDVYMFPVLTVSSLFGYRTTG